MKLRQLLKGASVTDVKGSRDIDVTGICGNSRVVAPGNIFVARRGKTFDGQRFIPEALEAGAVAVLTDLYDPSLKGVTQIVCSNINEAEATLAARVYGQPSRSLFVVGVTGTNGKTTTAFLVKQLLDSVDGVDGAEACGLIGTVQYCLGRQRYDATQTTPDVSSNHKLLREMLAQGCHSAVIEMSSHGLVQGRVAEVDVDVAIFTNLSREHLDYHQDMDAYAAAKQLLFLGLDPNSPKAEKWPRLAIVNSDDSWYKTMVEGCRVPVLTFGIENDANIRAEDLRLYIDRTEFMLHYQEQHVPFTLPLVGRYNVSNALATIAVGITRGIPLDSIARVLATADPVPGRMEVVPNTLGIAVYVDFAHTPDSLENVLSTVRELGQGKVITVFGCGGDRDRGKRPEMGRNAEKLSDRCVITSDNPRSEDPSAICQEILCGCLEPSRCDVEVDRAKAIRLAIANAKPGDIVVIAGKGHESRQIFDRRTEEFNDRNVAAAACRDLVMAP